MKATVRYIGGNEFVLRCFGRGWIEARLDDAGLVWLSAGIAVESDQVVYAGFSSVE